MKLTVLRQRIRKADDSHSFAAKVAEHIDEIDNFQANSSVADRFANARFSIVRAKSIIKLLI
jgi:hypothetical protein